jgi:hypothetical protein
MLGSGSSLAAGALIVSLLVNAALIFPRVSPAIMGDAVPFVLQRHCASDAEMKCSPTRNGGKFCSCDGRPLGAGTAFALKYYYPYGNKSLDSIYDTSAFMNDNLIKLKGYRAKAILIGNTASN